VNRYVFVELAKPFVFFVLVFTGLIWLSQSLRVIETVVNNGQAARALLEFSVLLLPPVMSIVLPVSAFGATIYAVNKLFGDSELVAMSAAGMSRLALMRPVALFGAVVLLMMVVVTLVLMPLAERSFRERVALLRADVANGLLLEGQFLDPADGLTVYVRQSDGSGAMLGVFVHDSRADDAELTYTAREALLNRGEEGPRLIMRDGLVQRFDTTTRTLSVLRFDSLVYDLTPFTEPVGDRTRRPSERFVTELWAPSEELIAVFGLGRINAELHDNISAPLYALTLPLIAVAGIVGGGFTRHGYGGRIAATVLAGTAVRLGGIATKAVVGGAPLAWPLLYAPPMLGILAAIWWLESSGRRRFARVGAA
jgi:lipopolysaccharide export system permease protein